MGKWYVLHVKTGMETKTQAALIKELPEFKVLVPQKTLKERHDGIWKEITRTLFPGYVFVNIFMDASMYYKLTGIPSVIKILGDTKGPLPVPEDEMQIVLKLSGDGDPLGISNVFIEGSKVKVLSGPLEGFEGQILKVDTRRFRAKINITLMGDPRIVELGVNVIEKI
jgi:transcriptional antiterminator NusG